MTPTNVFVAFGNWINNNIGTLIENKLTFSKQITTAVSKYREAHNASQGLSFEPNSMVIERRQLG